MWCEALEMKARLTNGHEQEGLACSKDDHGSQQTKHVSGGAFTPQRTLARAVV